MVISSFTGFIIIIIIRCIIIFVFLLFLFFFFLPLDFPSQQLQRTKIGTHILTNRRVIFPLLDPEYDPGARETLARAFPEHEIIGLESRETLLHGGDLHCISQQLPARA